MSRGHSLDAEIIYESPRVSSGKKSTSIHFRNVNKCLVCNREEKHRSDDCSLSCECYSDRFPSCSNSSDCSEINLKSNKRDTNIHSNEFRCRECQPCYKCTIDEVPVRDEESIHFKRNNPEFDKGMKEPTSEEKASELQTINENIEEYNPKNTKLFTVFESESSNASNRNGKDKNVESLAIKKHSVELQTDESSTDASNEDFLNTLVKNMLQKLLSNSKHTFNKQEFDDFVDRNRLKCKCAIEKILQNMIDYNALNYSDESTSKEEEMASYNYRDKGISTDVETETISTSESNVNPKNITDLKVKNQPNILITAETNNRKEPYVAEINKTAITYQDIIQELLKKCIEHDKVSEMSCTIEHSESKQTSLTDSQKVFNSNSQVSPHSTVKVRLSKNFHSEISDHKGFIDQSIKKSIEHSESKQILFTDSQDIQNSKLIVSPHSTVNVKLSNNFRSEISDHIDSTDQSKKTKYKTEPDIPVQPDTYTKSKDSLAFDLAENIFESTANHFGKSRKSLSENNLHRSNECKWTEKEEKEKQCKIKRKHQDNFEQLGLKTIDPSAEILLPVKLSYAKKNLHFEDSTNFEKSGFMSKLCMFFCKKICRD